VRSIYQSDVPVESSMKRAVEFMVTTPGGTGRLHDRGAIELLP